MLSTIKDNSFRIFTFLICIILCFTLVVTKPLQTIAEPTTVILIVTAIINALSTYSLIQLGSDIANDPAYKEFCYNFWDNIKEQIHIGVYGTDLNGEPAEFFFDKIPQYANSFVAPGTAGTVVFDKNTKHVAEVPNEIHNELFTSIIKHFKAKNDLNVCTMTYSPSEYKNLYFVAKHLVETSSKNFFFKSKASVNNSFSRLSFNLGENNQVNGSIQIEIFPEKFGEANSTIGSVISPLSFYYKDADGTPHYLTINMDTPAIPYQDLSSTVTFYLYHPIKFGKDVRFILRVKSDAIQNVNTYAFSTDEIYLDGSKVTFKNGFVYKDGIKIAESKSITHWAYSILAKASKSKALIDSSYLGKESEGEYTNIYTGYNTKGEKVATGTATSEEDGIVSVVMPGSKLSENVTNAINGVEYIPWEATPSDAISNTDAPSISQTITNVGSNSLTVDDVITMAPSSDIPDIKDWELPSKIISKFPFSIPFDLYNLVTIFDGNTVAPIWEIKFPIPSTNKTYNMIINPLEYGASKYFSMFRYFILTIYCLGLVLITRKLIRG